MWVSNNEIMSGVFNASACTAWYKLFIDTVMDAVIGPLKNGVVSSIFIAFCTEPVSANCCFHRETRRNSIEAPVPPCCFRRE